jgi:hypothetical protein
MRHSLTTVSIAGVLLLAAVSAASPQASGPLTNDSVVKMVKNHVGTDLIIQMIQNQPGAYVLTPDTIIGMKQQGMPESVLSAMLAKQQPPAAGPNAVPSGDTGKITAKETAKRKPDSPPANMWVVRDETDRISGGRSFAGAMWQPAMVQGSVHGELHVSATCDPEILKFTIVYLSDADIGLKQNDYGQRIVPGGLLGALTVAAGHQKPWVDMRVRVDQFPPMEVSSEDDYNNEATIIFSAQSVDGAMSAADAPRRKPGDNQIANLARVFVAAKSVGTMDQAFNAKTILVQLPLGDGSTTILEINPADPSFRTFSARCGAPLTSATRAPVPAAPTPVRTRPNVPPRQLDTFTGTATAFADALSKLMDKASIANGFDPRRFDAETAYITQLVKTCAAITPQMLANVTDTMNRAHLEKLDERFRPCGQSFQSVTVALNHGFKPGDPSVNLSLPSIGLWKYDPTLKNRFTNGNGALTVRVMLSGLPTAAKGGPFAYTVVVASIQ